MTEQELQQIKAAKAALGKATPGPWWIERDGQKGTPHIEDNYEDWIAQLAITPAMMGHIEANATIIAAAPALVRRVQELEEEVKELTEPFDSFWTCMHEEKKAHRKHIAELEDWQARALPHIQRRYDEDTNQVESVVYEVDGWEKNSGYVAVVNGCKERLPELDALIAEAKE